MKGSGNFHQVRITFIIKSIFGLHVTRIIYITLFNGCISGSNNNEQFVIEYRSVNININVNKYTNERRKRRIEQTSREENIKETTEMYMAAVFCSNRLFAVHCKQSWKSTSPSFDVSGNENEKIKIHLTLAVKLPTHTYTRLYTEKSISKHQEPHKTIAYTVYIYIYATIICNQGYTSGCMRVLVFIQLAHERGERQPLFYIWVENCTCVKRIVILSFIFWENLTIYTKTYTANVCYMWYIIHWCYCCCFPWLKFSKQTFSHM